MGKNDRTIGKTKPVLPVSGQDVPLNNLTEHIGYDIQVLFTPTQDYLLCVIIIDIIPNRNKIIENMITLWPWTWPSLFSDGTIIIFYIYICIYIYLYMYIHIQMYMYTVYHHEFYMHHEWIHPNGWPGHWHLQCCRALPTGGKEFTRGDGRLLM